jgi:hypothetical protein
VAYSTINIPYPLGVLLFRLLPLTLGYGSPQSLVLRPFDSRSPFMRPRRPHWTSPFFFPCFSLSLTFQLHYKQRHKDTKTQRHKDTYRSCGTHLITLTRIPLFDETVMRAFCFNSSSSGLSRCLDQAVILYCR